METNITFINKIIYQIFQKTDNGHFELPLHKYTFNNEDILMPQKKYWFTKIANSSLNNVLQNSIDQKKPSLLEIKYQFSYLLIIIILLSSELSKRQSFRTVYILWLNVL